MAPKASAVTPWDEHFEPSAITAVSASPPPSRAQHRPLNVPDSQDATLSALQGTSIDQDVHSERPATAQRLSSFNPSHTSNLSTSTDSTSLRKSKGRRQSVKSQSTSNSSSDPSRKPSVSDASGSPSEKSKSSETLEVPRKKKGRGLLNFLTVKEPSTKAFEEFAAQQRRELKERGAERPFGVSSKKLPPGVPKVNSKWDGLPDDKRDLIKAIERQRKKEQEREKSQPNTCLEEQEDEMLYMRYNSPEVPPSRRSHITRQSTGSAYTVFSSMSSSEAYKTCDPKSRGPRARPKSSAPSLADSGHALAPMDETLALSMARMSLNRSSSLGSLPEGMAYISSPEECLQSDSDQAVSPDDWMPKTPSTPLPPTHAHMKSVPIVLPLTSPLEHGLQNVAPLAPFVTGPVGPMRENDNTRPTSSLTTTSTDKAKSGFAAGEAQELDFVSDRSEEDETQETLSSPNVSTRIPHRSSNGPEIAATAPSSPTSEVRRHSLAQQIIREHADGSNSSNSVSHFKSSKERLGLSGKIWKQNAIAWTPRDAQPPSPPPEEPSSQSVKKSRRSLFGMK